MTLRGTMLYVTEIGGDVVLKTTASGRLWGGAGAVLHWLYFAPLRRNAALWNELMVWSSIAGTLMCLAGMAWGLWRISPFRGYRLRRERHWSPYAIEEVSWLDRYDAYYYDRDGRLSLPVLRARYGDPQHTWLYFDPRHAAIARKEGPSSVVGCRGDRAEPRRHRVERDHARCIVAPRETHYLGVSILKG